MLFSIVIAVFSVVMILKDFLIMKTDSVQKTNVWKFMDFLGNVFILAHAVCLVVLEINMYEYQVSKGLLILGVGLISIRTFSMLGIFSYFRF